MAYSTDYGGTGEKLMTRNTLKKDLTDLILLLSCIIQHSSTKHKIKMLFPNYISQCSGYSISVDLECLYCHREFYWTVLLQKTELEKP